MRHHIRFRRIGGIRGHIEKYCLRKTNIVEKA